MHIVNLLGVIGGLITTSGGIPQIIKIIKTKSADDLSWGMLSLNILGLILTTIYAVINNQIPIYVGTVLSITLCIIIIRLKIKYSSQIQQVEYEPV